MDAKHLLEVKDLETHFHTDDGIVRAVDRVSFSVRKGETLGIVGESGCGKSITSLSILNMVPRPGKIVGGSIRFRRRDGSEFTITDHEPKSAQVREVRGSEIAMIFQEPMTAFTPVYTVGWQIREAILTHQQLSKKAAGELAVELLDYVGIGDPRRRYDEYPHQFSGGMRQRAMIAMALSCDPILLIADEPTTALDVTIEAQILKLLRDIQQERGMSIILITHDLAVIGEMADRVVVMYMGNVVEQGTVDHIFHSTRRHPYTEGLLASIPEIGRRTPITAIAGSTPNAFALPSGCVFHPRCPYIMDLCPTSVPELYETDEAHFARCFLHRAGISEHPGGLRTSGHGNRSQAGQPPSPDGSHGNDQVSEAPHA